ncbi:MAG: GntR family transcriptional regulator [Pseudomonadales bacterium]|jgi:GntR family transcriptional regulator
MTDWNDSEPIYLQLKDLILKQIMLGTLLEGEAIASVRQVAGQERINPITVSRAFQILVEEGLLEKHRGVGMFVCTGAQSKALDREQRRFLEKEWPAMLDRIALLGLKPETLLTDLEPSP